MGEAMTITMGDQLAPRFAQDSATRHWALDSSPDVPTRVNVVNYAQRELAALQRLPFGWDGANGLPLRSKFASAALMLVTALTFRDALATPQFSPLPDGGVNIIWLVDGDDLSITLDTEEIGISGTWADGREAFDHDLVQRPELLSAAIDEARVFLDKISMNVRHQLRAW